MIRLTAITKVFQAAFLKLLVYDRAIFLASVVKDILAD